MNQEPSQREADPWHGPALGLALMLLPWALTHCGGKERSEQAGSGGASIAGESAVATLAGSGSSSAWGGGAGTGHPYIDVPPLMPGGTSPAEPVCNALDPGPPAIAVVIAEDPPKPEGGTIPNGLFRLTRHEVFIGRNGNSDQRVSRMGGRTLLISASTAASADLQLSRLENLGELPDLVNESQTLVVSGTSYDYTVTCSSERDFAPAGTRHFTATADELIWISLVSDGTTYVETFERE